MRNSNGKLNWTAISVTIGFVAMILGWAWSIEHRLGMSMDVNGRLTNIEDALYPVLVDYKVNKILNEHNHDFYGNLEDPTIPAVPIVSTDQPEFQLIPDEDVTQSAEVWAQEQLIYKR